MLDTSVHCQTELAAYLLQQLSHFLLLRQLRWCAIPLPIVCLLPIVGAECVIFVISGTTYYE